MAASAKAMKGIVKPQAGKPTKAKRPASSSMRSYVRKRSY